MPEPNPPTEGPVARMLRARLEAAFAPLDLVIENQSERHRGHAGWDPSGESHFAVTIVSPAFEACPASPASAPSMLPSAGCSRAASTPSPSARSPPRRRPRGAPGEGRAQPEVP